jgi:hypothetical protein
MLEASRVLGRVELEALLMQTEDITDSELLEMLEHPAH